MALTAEIFNSCVSGKGQLIVECTTEFSQIIHVQLLLDGVSFSGNRTSGSATTFFTTTFSDVPNGTHKIQVYGTIDSNSDSTTYLPDDNPFVSCIAEPDPVTCDLVYTDLTVINDRNNAGIGQITANATSSAAIEYSLDSLFNWQSSPTFTGVSAGLHTVYFRDANGCTATRYNIVVSNLACNLVINSLTVTHETSEGLNDGSVIISASSLAPGDRTYKLDSGAYQTSNEFTGIAPGDHTVYVLDGAGCTASESFTITEFQPAYVDAPRANSLRFISKETVDGCSVFQNEDNTLFADMVFPGHGRSCYYQKVQKCDGPMKIQWMSNYSTNEIEVTNQHTSSVTTYAASIPTLPDVYVSPTEYNIIEASIAWNDLPSGYYDVKLKGTDTVRGSYALYGEPVHLKVEHKHTVLITYKNSESNFDVEYLTGIEHKIRVAARFFQATNPGKRQVMTSGRGQVYKLNERLFRKKRLEVFLLPFYLHEKLSIAFAHDYFTVNGQRFQSEENYEYKYKQLFSLLDGEVELTLYDFNVNNTHDSGNINSSSDQFLELEHGDYLEL